MKVPHSVVGRTRPSGQGLNYLQAADTTGIGRGVAGGLQALAAGVQLYEGKKDQQTKFTALSNLSEFETKVAEDITRLKRDQSIDVANFPEQAAGAYKNMQDKFVAESIPAELQGEFRYRTDEIKQRVIADALNFQFTSQDQFYTVETGKEYEKARTALANSADPKKDLENWSRRLAEQLAASGLPQQEKVRLAREFDIGLQSVVYKQTYQQQQIEAATTPGGDAQNSAFGLIQQFEGFRDTPYWDVNADRIGYGSDQITLPDGTVQSVTKGMTVSRDDAARDLNRRIRVFEQGAIEKVGAREWGALPSNVKAGLISVAYNYGSLPSSVSNAVKTGNIEEIASAVESLSSNKERRKKEAAIIRGQEQAPSASIDDDPRFRSLPYDTRVALQNDANVDAKSFLTGQNTQRKAAYDAQFNTFLNGIQDGNRGQNDIKNAYNDGKGWLTDYDDRKKAQDLWEKRNEDLSILSKAQAKLNDSTSVWDPNSTDDKKYQNALFGKEGLAALSAHDPEYAARLAVNAARTQDIATDAIGALSGMMRSPQNERMAYAYNSMALLQQYAPDAFKQRTTDDVAANVAFWAARKDTMPEEELMAALRGGTTQAERQQKTMLREEAKTILRTQVKKIPTGKALVADFIDDFNTWTSSASTYNIPWAARGLEVEFQTAFIDAYEMYGNEDDAVEAAKEMMKRSWGMSNIGTPTLMKFPPESFYKPYDGGYDWIDKQVRETMELGPDVEYQLISDDQTNNEVDRLRRGADVTPSYMIAVKTDKGWTMRQRDQPAASLPGGIQRVPVRMNFVPDAELQLKEETNFQRRAVEQELKTINNKLNVRPAGEGTMFKAPEGELQNLRDRQKELSKELLRLTPPEETPPTRILPERT